MLSLAVIQLDEKLIKRERNILITTKFIYLFKKKGFPQIFQTTYNKIDLKNQYPLNTVLALTYLQEGGEFIIHLEKETDLFIKHKDSWLEILEFIDKAYLFCNNKRVTLYSIVTNFLNVTKRKMKMI